MDPKQERVLRDGTAGEEDQPRPTDRDSIRVQAENPPIDERPRPRRRTGAVADIRINLPSGTPVEDFARASGAERIPELGHSDDREGPGNGQPERSATVPRGKPEMAERPRSDEREARRTLKARREHSKGDGNFPTPEKAARLTDELPQDRVPRDLPKSRDDRSAPKGNDTAGQTDRNPDLEVRDDYEPRRGESRTTRARRTAGRKTPRKTSRVPARRPGKKAAKSQTRAQPGRARRNPQARAAAARGSRKPATKRSVRGAGPRGSSGSTRGGKR
jgi:hypothetical protein